MGVSRIMETDAGKAVLSGQSDPYACHGIRQKWTPIRPGEDQIIILERSSPLQAHHLLLFKVFPQNGTGSGRERNHTLPLRRLRRSEDHLPVPQLMQTPHD
jgi:hypothetical protein